MNGIATAFQGYVGGDPETKFTGTGKQLLTFSLGVTENRLNGDGAETVWLRVTAWEADAERLAETLRKGAEVYVEGKLSHREWTGKDGEQRCGLSVSAWKVELLGAIGRKAPRRDREAAA